MTVRTLVKLGTYFFLLGGGGISLPFILGGFLTNFAFWSVSNMQCTKNRVLGCGSTNKPSLLPLLPNLFMRSFYFLFLASIIFLFKILYRYTGRQCSQCICPVTDYCFFSGDGFSCSICPNDLELGPSIAVFIAMCLVLVSYYY